MNIGKAITLVRGKLNLTTHDVAERMGVSPEQVLELEQKLELEKDELHSVCKALDVAPEIILLLSIQRMDIQKGKEQNFDTLKDPLDNFLVEIIGSDAMPTYKHPKKADKYK